MERNTYVINKCEEFDILKRHFWIYNNNVGAKKVEQKLIAGQREKLQ